MSLDSCNKKEGTLYSLNDPILFTMLNTPFFQIRTLIGKRDYNLPCLWWDFDYDTLFDGNIVIKSKDEWIEFMKAVVEFANLPLDEEKI